MQSVYMYERTSSKARGLALGSNTTGTLAEEPDSDTLPLSFSS